MYEENSVIRPHRELGGRLKMKEYKNARLDEIIWQFPNEFIARFWSYSCAKRVLWIFEKEFPKDYRIRYALVIIKKFSLKRATLKELKLAEEIAREAARKAWEVAQLKRFPPELLAAKAAASATAWAASVNGAKFTLVKKLFTPLEVKIKPELIWAFIISAEAAISAKGWFFAKSSKEPNIKVMNEERQWQVKLLETLIDIWG